VALLVVIGAVLRAVPWLACYPLHRDEALYGYWARLIATGRDPLLLTPWIDKPPLVLYLLAGSLRIFGASVQALRLPGMIASILAVLAVYGFARRAYGMWTALLATAFAALSPFAILFAPTAFTDPWLTLWLVLAAWAALSRRPFLAGLALGLAVASKQQGVLGVPLILALIVLRSGGFSLRLRVFAPLLFRSILGFALVFGPVTYWDSLRWVNRPSYWDRSLATYGGLYLAPLAQWAPRAAAWATQAGYLFGTPALSAFMLLLVGAVGVRGVQRALVRRRMGEASAELPAPAFAAAPASIRPENIDWMLAVYVTGYLALHVIVTFQPWDRYLLPLVPLVSILAARGIALAARWAWSGGGADDMPAQPASRALKPGVACLLNVRRADMPVQPARRALKHPAQADASRLKPATPAPRALSRFQPASVGFSRFTNGLGNQVASPRQARRRLKCPIQRGRLSPPDTASALKHTGRPVRPIVNLFQQVCGLPDYGFNRRRPGSVRHTWRTCLIHFLTCFRRQPQPRQLLVAALPALVLVPALAYAGWLGATGRLPVGSDHGAYAGLDQVVAILRDQPADAVIYHRWLSWHYDFYLFDAPQERRWWGTGQKLAGDASDTARTEPGRPQWIVLPAWEIDAEAEARQALAARGLVLKEMHRIYRPDGSRSFTMYEIVPSQVESPP